MPEETERRPNAVSRSSTLLVSLRKSTRRVTKGFILIGWITVLLWLAYLSATQTGEQILNQLGTPLAVFQSRMGSVSRSPSVQLANFLSRRFPENPPPLDAILSSIIANPNWTDSREFRRRLVDTVGVPQAEADRQLAGDYEHLFSIVTDHLIALVDNRDLNPKEAEISEDIIPDLFGGSRPARAVVATGLLAPWIARERQRIDEERMRTNLINTFVILIVLGAFGSMIFLTRDYIAFEVETTIAAYMFRPILGMFLAVAMFVVDLLAHSVVSTAPMTEIRNEPLYLLAFAAGLLSEQAYGFVHHRAEVALQKYKGPEA